MVRAEQSNHAKAYLRKAEEYIESAEDNLELERYTPIARGRVEGAHRTR